MQRLLSLLPLLVLLFSGGCGQRRLTPFVNDVHVAPQGGAFCIGTAALPGHRHAQYVFPSVGQAPLALYYDVQTGWPSEIGWPINAGRQLLYVQTHARPDIVFFVTLYDRATKTTTPLYSISRSKRLHRVSVVSVAPDSRTAVLKHSESDNALLTSGRPESDQHDWWLERLNLKTRKSSRLTPTFRTSYETWVAGVDASMTTGLIKTPRGIVEWPLGQMQGTLAKARVRFPFGSAVYGASLDASAMACAAFVGTRRNEDPDRVPDDNYLAYNVEVWRDGEAAVLASAVRRGTCALSPSGSLLAWQQIPIRGRSTYLNLHRLRGGSYVREFSLKTPRKLRGLAWIDEKTVLAWDELNCRAYDSDTGQVRDVARLDKQGRLSWHD